MELAQPYGPPGTLAERDELIKVRVILLFSPQIDVREDGPRHLDDPWEHLARSSAASGPLLLFPPRPVHHLERWDGSGGGVPIAFNAADPWPASPVPLHDEGRPAVFQPGSVTPGPATIPPACRPDLLLRPLGDRGRHVVKDPRTGAFFTLGEQEAFLLTQLDGERDTETICKAFEERFGEPLSGDDLDGFLELARSRGFLQPPAAEPATAQTETAPAAPAAEPPAPQAKARQSLLYWRKSLFDPDRLFNWLAPKIALVWTRPFLFASAGCIVLAAVVVFANGREMVSAFPRAWHWQTALLAWLTLIVATTLHEFAHGLTCKRHGGEVHEVGFLAMFFLPCFYCNVSDAWLFREKSKRLAVTLAGGYCDLCLWALAVFAWRLAAPDSLVNYLALVVLSVLGARVFFNFNPLLKLDGYYLLSDWLEVPNLRQRGWERLAGWLRCLLWGAARPAPVARGRFLLAYGLVSWVFSLFFLALMLIGFYQFLGSRLGAAGGGLTVLLGSATLPGMFRGFAQGEVRKMVLTRFLRTAAWLLGLAGLVSLLFLAEVEDRVGGPFEVRPAVRAELRAPVAGFLREVYFEEGQRVSAGALVARLDVPDLDSRLAQGRAAVRESEAKLRLLKVGPRPEEVVEQRGRVDRARAWRDLGEQDLGQERKALREDLLRLDKQIARHQAELDFAQNVLSRSRKLMAERALSQDQYREGEKNAEVARALMQQAQAQKRAREELGSRSAETELARRDKELADARSVLRLLEAGSRPEEIEAEQARLARLREEVRHLEDVQGKLQVLCPVSGLVVTPRLKERVGRHLSVGELICEVEEPGLLEVDITVDESDVARVGADQVVELRPRALPLLTFTTTVERVAPRAVRAEGPATASKPAPGELASAVTVICRLEGADTGLQPGMTGHARINCGRRSPGELLGMRVLRLVRTEFWW